MVRDTRSTWRAISLGVFCRTAPSTSLIIRSMNVWPGSAVMRTTIRSERTLVPPVTEDRSPPDSRITGADSPVMVDSSTLARPSMISPSEGMTSPASQMTMSLSRSSVPGTSLVVPSACRSRAWTPLRLARRLSAWALPRPSAMDSDRVPKRTVSHSQAVTAMPKTDGPVHGDRRAQGGPHQHGEHDRGMDHLPRGEFPDCEGQCGDDAGEREFCRGLGVVFVLAGGAEGVAVGVGLGGDVRLGRGHLMSPSARGPRARAGK